VVSGSNDGSLLVWDANNGSQVRPPLQGHTAPVHALASGQLPDGRTIVVSGSDDGTVRVWDLAHGVPVGTPQLDPATLPVRQPGGGVGVHAKLDQPLVAAGEARQGVGFQLGLPGRAGSGGAPGGLQQ
jgi:hypothetical protein